MKSAVQDAQTTEAVEVIVKCEQMGRKHLIPFQYSLLISFLVKVLKMIISQHILNSNISPMNDIIITIIIMPDLFS